VSETWTYDPLGNHLVDSTTTESGTTTTDSTFNYDNQITAMSGYTTPEYDSDGNMTTDQSGLKYTYNAWGQLISVENSDDQPQESYSYDGLGDRMTNTVYSDDVGTTTNFYYSTTGQVLEEQANATGYYTQRYVWSPAYVNEMIIRDTDTSGSGLDSTVRSYSRIWAVQDASYNVVAIVNNSGSVVERYSYDPFGTVTVMSPGYTVRESSCYNWVYGFQGGRLDTVTGDTNFGARNEDPSTGTWTSEDPLGFGGGNVDLYGFVGNNPIAYVDPSGLDRGVLNENETINLIKSLTNTVANLKKTIDSTNKLIIAYVSTDDFLGNTLAIYQQQKGSNTIRSSFVERIKKLASDCSDCADFTKLINDLYKEANQAVSLEEAAYKKYISLDSKKEKTEADYEALIRAFETWNFMIGQSNAYHSLLKELMPIYIEHCDSLPHFDPPYTLPRRAKYPNDDIKDIP
jgi:RHS repeat-associated protein